MPDPAMRDQIMTIYEQRVVELANRLARKEITLADWQHTMLSDLRDSYALQLRAGASTPTVSKDDYAKIGALLLLQVPFLESFAQEISAGTVAPDAIAGRAMLYVRPGQTMFWKQATGHIDLPAYPGDGTFCRCGCSWRLEPQDDGSVDAYWDRSLDNSCNICRQRAEDWNPYHVPAPEGATQ